MNGEGVPSEYESPLIGDYTVGELSKVIMTRCPKTHLKSAKVQTLKRVAAYIHQAFYSESAQIRIRRRESVWRVSLEHSFAKALPICMQLDGVLELAMTVGLKECTSMRAIGKRRRRSSNGSMRRSTSILSAISSRGRTTSEEFYIYWDGNIKVDESGKYEMSLSAAVVRL